MPSLATLDGWIARDAITFGVDSPASIDAAVDRIVGDRVGGVELLGLGEALHGSEEILVIRNRMFQRLAEAHGYSAVVIEVTSPQARVIYDYVLGVRGSDDPTVIDWFNVGFGRLDANRELIEWMRQYNVHPSHAVKLHFYGFDIPLGQGGLASPSRVVEVVLEYLDAVDPASGHRHRERFTQLVGDVADWERPAAFFDPGQSIGLSPAAAELRLATQDLITDLRVRGPELVGRSGPPAYSDALHHAELLRKLLNAHAALARPGAYAEMLGIRDLIMADNLEHILASERGRGKVLVFAGSGHLQRSQAHWHLPPGQDVKVWWPAGSQLAQSMGPRFAVIGMALGVSDENGIGEPEPGTLEARLARAGEALFLPTHFGYGLPAGEIAALPVRSGSSLNPTYSPLSPVSFTDWDWLVFLTSTTYPRGAPPLSNWNSG